MRAYWKIVVFHLPLHPLEEIKVLSPITVTERMFEMKEDGGRLEVIRSPKIISPTHLVGNELMKLRDGKQRQRNDEKEWEHQMYITIIFNDNVRVKDEETTMISKIGGFVFAQSFREKKEEMRFLSFGPHLFIPTVNITTISSLPVFINTSVSINNEKNDDSTQLFSLLSQFFQSLKQSPPNNNNNNKSNNENNNEDIQLYKGDIVMIPTTRQHQQHTFIEKMWKLFESFFITQPTTQSLELNTRIEGSIFSSYLFFPFDLGKQYHKIK